MIDGKIVGTELALMVADMKRVSQVFGRFKSFDMLEVSKVLEGIIFVEIDNISQVFVAGSE